MIVRDILFILRRPTQPNVYVHRACYQPSKHLVQGVLEMRENELCGVCGMSVWHRYATPLRVIHATPVALWQEIEVA